MAWENPQDSWNGLDMRKLNMDEAYMEVIYKESNPIWLYRLSSNCHACPWQIFDPDQQILLGLNTTYKIHTHHPMRFLVHPTGSQPYLMVGGEEEEKALCSTKELSFGEFGVYQFNADDCTMTTVLEPVNANFALLFWFLVILGGAVLWFGLKRIPGNPLGKLALALGWSKPVEKGGSGRVRLRSLDTFRGISIALMIFVNDGGGGYWFMEHATWNGLYVADLVFPWFLWIMGVCIPMSVKSNIKKEIPTRSVIWGVAVRSVKLFILGFILNTVGWLDLSRLRVPGVLQRFGICYFVVFLVCFCFTRANPVKPLRLAWATDLIHLWPQWVIMSLILLVHQLIVYLVPAPGCEAGYAGPGGLHDWTPTGNNSGCIGGITGYVDKAFFTSQHIYGNPTAKAVYSASAFDPEGILGSLISMFQVFLGYQAGYILQVYPGHKDRLLRWGFWSILTGGLGALLCGASQEDGWVPINKNLWSISFVLVTSSFAFVLLSLLYIVIDLKNWWKGQPFFYAGMNSILLYCGHQVGWQIFPFHWVIGDMRTHMVRLPEALWGAALWILVSFILYRKKVFVTV